MDDHTPMTPAWFSCVGRPLAAAEHAAAGAALLAAHQQALAELAGEGGTHFFGFKYALFAGGRWPLGHHRGRYVVF